MTKVGEGNLPIEEPGEASYQQQLDRSSTKFLDALGQFNQSKNPEEQEHLRALMDLQMGLIQSAVSELKRDGIQKQGEKVGKDYAEYTSAQTEDGYLKLHDDVETLKDYGSLS